MFEGRRVAVVVPAYNEERLIDRVLDTMPAMVDRIIVVDDCSTDATAERLAAAGPRLGERLRVIRHAVNGGVGAAIVTGYQAALEELDEGSLTSILSQPKNALVKQYRKLFDLDGVTLKFTDGALKAIASEAIRRKAGARGLRSILESAMLDVMYDIPSQKTAREVVISEEVILKKSEPVILHATEKDELQKESA